MLCIDSELFFFFFSVNLPTNDITHSFFYTQIKWFLLSKWLSSMSLLWQSFIRQFGETFFLPFRWEKKVQIATTHCSLNQKEISHRIHEMNWRRFFGLFFSYCCEIPFGINIKQAECVCFKNKTSDFFPNSLDIFILEQYSILFNLTIQT